MHKGPVQSCGLNTGCSEIVFVLVIVREKKNLNPLRFFQQ